MAGTGLQGAYALQSLDDLLRQRMLDRLQAEAAAEHIRQFDVRTGEATRQHQADEAERMRQHTLIQQQRADALEAARQQREDVQTQQFAMHAPPSEDIGSEMAGRLRTLGLGSLTQERILPEGQRGEPTAIAPGVLTTGGGDLTGLPGGLRSTTAGTPAFAMPQGGFQAQAQAQAAADRAAQAGEAERVRGHQQQELAAQRAADAAERQQARTEDRLAQAAQSQADRQANIRLAASLRSPGAADTTATDIADAITRGEQSPQVRGLFRYAAPVRSELAKRGFNLAKAETDWNATQRHFASLNGPQQTRLRQGVQTASDSLDKVDQLADAWDGLHIGPLGRLKLAAARQGILGQQAQSLSVQLTNQIADLSSELGTVYQGGGVPTTQALKLAEQNLQDWWGNKTLHDMTNQARFNLNVRRHAMDTVDASTTGTTGAGALNRTGATTPSAGPSRRQYYDAQGRPVAR